MPDLLDAYIYESPDNGETVYRRRHGEIQRELVRQPTTSRWDLLKKQQLWSQIHRAGDKDPELKTMLEQIEVYWHLKNQKEEN
jgi:hypothetical protein